MRVVINIAFFLCVVCTSAFAQSPDEKLVNFRVKNLSLEETFYALSDAAKVDIIFSNSILPASKNVSFRFKKKSVGYIIKQILQGLDLTYIVSGSNQIRLVEKAQPRQRKVTISGYLIDAETGEALIGAAIQDSLSGRGTFSNTYGFYSLTLPTGRYALKAGYLGYQAKRLSINLLNSQKIDFELEPAITLSEIIIYAADEDASYGTPTKLGTQSIQLREIKSAPGVGGENDIIKAVHQMTGVQTGADGFGGFTVRGGNVDQNLVLLDGVPVYNSLHALGIYSIFNNSTIKSTKLIRGVFPARYGGRISSVLDIRTKEGNNRNLSGEMEIGPLSGNILLEGPIKKEKSSYMLSYRRSFLDLYSRPFSTAMRQSDTTSGVLAYHFYDVNAKVNFQLKEKDKIFFSLYAGEDRFSDKFDRNFRLNFFAPDPAVVDTTTQINFEQSQNWGNIIASARWNHTFTDKMFANTTFTYTRFFFQNIEPRSQTIFVEDEVIDSLFNVSRFNSNNQDIAGKIDFEYTPSEAHKVLFGAATTLHTFQPQIIQFAGNIPVDTFNQVVENRIERPALRSAEYDVYVEDEWQINSRWHINPGIRMSIIQSPGKNYYAFQPRIFATYDISESLFLQAAAGRVVQPVHLLTTTGRGRAEDLWVSATSRIKPIESSQYSLGLELHPSYSWIFSLEAYYKNMKNILAFQEGFIENIDAKNWQNSVVAGEGQAQGLEFSIRKPRGKFTMALNYTLASSTRRFDDLNLGQSFRHQFDRRHNFNLSINQETGRRSNFTANFVLQSGSLTTVPQASYRFTLPSLLFPYRGRVLVYSGLSNVSLPTYHRLDLGWNIYWSANPVKHLLKIGVYNIYNRQNTSYYNVSSDCLDENSDFCYKQTTLVPILPYFRYQIKF